MSRGRFFGARGTVGSALAVVALSSIGASPHAAAQQPTEGEVRQLVTFRFLPGRGTEAQAMFRERAVPLYRENQAMLSFRGFREVESPVPLDLVVVSAFRGMDGMDASNDALSELATQAGTSIGAVYGEIASLSATHHDEFVAVLPSLSWGDPASKSLVAFVWYRTLPGEQQRFEHALAERALPREEAAEVPVTTGRFLVADGWDYLRVLGFDSLGDYQAYWQQVAPASHGYIDALTAVRREVILAPVPALSVR